MKVKSNIAIGLAAAALLAAASPACATAYFEDFEAGFPAWETGWFGANSDAQDCYGVGGGRGNNPDGLWVAGAGQGCSGTPVRVNFDAPFAATLTSFALDVAGYSGTVLTIFDKDGASLFSGAVALTFGAFGDPGVYSHYGVNSSNGIGGFSFSGAAAGNTSIDNLAANGGTAGVPEPSAWALLIAGFGLAGTALRRRRMSLAV